MSQPGVHSKLAVCMLELSRKTPEQGRNEFQEVIIAAVVVFNNKTVLARYSLSPFIIIPYRSFRRAYHRVVLLALPMALLCS